MIACRIVSTCAKASSDARRRASTSVAFTCPSYMCRPAARRPGRVDSHRYSSTAPGPGAMPLRCMPPSRSRNRSSVTPAGDRGRRQRIDRRRVVHDRREPRRRKRLHETDEPRHVGPDRLIREQHVRRAGARRHLRFRDGGALEPGDALVEVHPHHLAHLAGLQVRPQPPRIPDDLERRPDVLRDPFGIHEQRRRRDVGHVVDGVPGHGDRGRHCTPDGRSNAPPCSRVNSASVRSPLPPLPAGRHRHVDARRWKRPQVRGGERVQDLALAGPHGHVREAADLVAGCLARHDGDRIHPGEVGSNPRHHEVVAGPHGARHDALALERVHADAHAVGGEAIEDRVGDHGVQPALARHGRDTAGERFGCGELPRAIGAAEHVLVDPVLVGLGSARRPSSRRRRRIQSALDTACRSWLPRSRHAHAVAQALEGTVTGDPDDRAGHPELRRNLG